MHRTIRWLAALLVPLIVLAVQPTAQAKKPGKNDIKQIAIIGAAAAAAEKMKPKAKPPQKAPAAPKVEIPGVPEEKPAANKKEAKKAAKEKAEAAKQAGDETFQTIAAMAKAGDVQAQYILGLAYYTGQQVKPDEKAAVEWWRQADIGGHPEAGAYVGLAYAQGLGDTLTNQEEAERRYLRAAKNGSALANVLLGIDSYNKNTPADKEKAIERFRTALQQGNPQAKAFLELITRRGTDARLNFGTNLDWNKEAKKTPLTDLYTQAGTNAFWGRIVEQDYTAAVSWWELAAKEDNATAEALLGTAYYTGRGVEQDEKKAVELFKTAAAQNEPLAQYMLGKAYLAGNVVQKNKELALKLFRAAGEAGIKDARRQADELEKRG
ncbi:tetratricopeptide repeat protein [Sporomusa sphaeroides]|uniref:tetratricopeptide repeat protein n=1 Tax=Sporomusa sphaeroides TaxID=47679 RepID=UPI002BFE194B|nr:tetratricopeptide repeat protein [Sporomusa sphaeroides]HML32135.1 tetratricopeptide repeat protein [Sporomusa sphaeroides]